MKFFLNFHSSYSIRKWFCNILWTKKARNINHRLQSENIIFRRKEQLPITLDNIII